MLFADDIHLSLLPAWAVCEVEEIDEQTVLPDGLGAPAPTDELELGDTTDELIQSLCASETRTPSVCTATLIWPASP